MLQDGQFLKYPLMFYMNKKGMVILFIIFLTFLGLCLFYPQIILDNQRMDIFISIVFIIGVIFSLLFTLRCILFKEPNLIIYADGIRVKSFWQKGAFYAWQDVQTLQLDDVGYNGFDGFAKSFGVVIVLKNRQLFDEPIKIGLVGMNFQKEKINAKTLFALIEQSFLNHQKQQGKDGVYYQFIAHKFLEVE